MLSDLALTDRNMLFADWGRPASLLQVTQFYDINTGLMDESTEVADVTVVAGQRMSHQSRTTGAECQDGECEFLVRDEELPIEIVWSLSRLVVGQCEYRILGTVTNPFDRTLLLKCVEVA